MTFNSINIVFAGTAEFAVPTLKTLLEHHNVLAVISAPDKPKGRGRKVKPSPIKEMVLGCCGAVEILTQPINKLAKQLTELKPDLIVVTAYGQLLGKEILAIPPLGCWNIHPSLLPKYRGPSPIQAAILNGDRETGVTIIQMTEKLDAGPIIAQEKVSIAPDETGGNLHDTLAEKGASLLQRTLKDFKSVVDLKSFYSIPQNDSLAIYTKKITANDAELNPKETAEILERKIRTFNPLPGAYITINYQLLITNDALLIINKSRVSKRIQMRLKIWRAKIKKGAKAVDSFTPDKNLIVLYGLPALLCGDGNFLLLTEVQPEGKKRISGEEFTRGYIKRK